VNRCRSAKRALDQIATRYEGRTDMRHGPCMSASYRELVEAIVRRPRLQRKPFGLQGLPLYRPFQGLSGPGTPCLKGNAIRFSQGWARFDQNTVMQIWCMHRAWGFASDHCPAKGDPKRVVLEKGRS